MVRASETYYATLSKARGVIRAWHDNKAVDKFTTSKFATMRLLFVRVFLVKILADVEVAQLVAVLIRCNNPHPISQVLLL